MVATASECRDNREKASGEPPCFVRPQPRLARGNSTRRGGKTTAAATTTASTTDNVF